MNRLLFALILLLAPACAREPEPPADAAEQAVLVTIDLTGDELGTGEEREAVSALGAALGAAVADAGAGEFDGDEFGGGEAVLYLYGPDAEALFAAIEPVLRADPLAGRIEVVRRAGPPGSAEKRSPLR